MVDRTGSYFNAEKDGVDLLVGLVHHAGHVGEHALGELLDDLRWRRALELVDGLFEERFELLEAHDVVGVDLPQTGDDVVAYGGPLRNLSIALSGLGQGLLGQLYSRVAKINNRELSLSKLGRVSFKGVVTCQQLRRRVS